MYDRIDRLGDTVFQHGPYNDRVYVMRTSSADLGDLLPYLENLATRRRYGKVIAKVPAPCREAFLEWGAREEAILPGYYGDTDAHFVARYFDEKRAQEREPDTVERNLAIAGEKAAEEPVLEARGWDHDVTEAGPEDAEEMSHVYQRVFPTYPFPIYDPAYLRQAMQSDVVFFKLSKAGRIGALASAEMDVAASAVEMTDFATLPELRGQGAAQSLLQAMEREMARREIRTTFTIARAMSAGMNVTFAKCGYEFHGTLVNNTNIAGRVESMNVWSRPL
jgi:putative beta-lysine N-acetyltransferase